LHLTSIAITTRTTTITTTTTTTTTTTSTTTTTTTINNNNNYSFNITNSTTAEILNVPDQSLLNYCQQTGRQVSLGISKISFFML
jgi:hypothetical protein